MQRPLERKTLGEVRGTHARDWGRVEGREVSDINGRSLVALVNSVDLGISSFSKDHW